jgi:N utilization substance protein B
MGTWELIEQREVPRAVVIDEAVELAKAYGTDESSSFVNGVLDRIATDLGRTDDRTDTDTTAGAAAKSVSPARNGS